MASGTSRSSGRTGSARRQSASSVESGDPRSDEGVPRPGDVLRKLLLERYDVTQEELAEAMGTTRYSVNQLLNNQRAVTADMAVRLGLVTDTTPELWLGLQQAIDLDRATEALRSQRGRIRPLRPRAAPSRW